MSMTHQFVSTFSQGTPGFTVYSQLKDFCAAVEHAIPGVKTYPMSSNRAWVYNPYDVITMGQIGFGDFTTSKKGVSAFMVASNNIANERYNSGSKQYHMVSRKSMAQAVKVAVQYLERPTPSDVSASCMHMIAGAVSSSRYDAQTTRNKTDVALLGVPHGRMSSPLMKELLRMREKGFRFEDQGVEQLFVEHVTAEAAFDDKQTKAVRTIIVRQNTVTVGIHRLDYGQSELKEVEHFRPEEVPEHILGRIAVLNMVATGVYVAGVGMKAQEGLYYAAF